MENNTKTAPFQSDRRNIQYPSHRITWEAHLAAYKEYAKQYGTSQSAERIAERGGFGDCELDGLFPDWKEFIIKK